MPLYSPLEVAEQVSGQGGSSRLGLARFGVVGAIADYAPDGSPDPDELSEPPFDDPSLEIFLPKVVDGRAYEAVSGRRVQRGPKWAGIGTSAGGKPTFTSGSSGGDVAYGSAPSSFTGDLSQAITIYLGEPPEDGVPMGVWQAAGLHIEALYESSTTFRIRAKIFIASGGSITTTSSDPLDIDTEYEIFVTHDVDGQEVSVKVDDVEVATGVAGARVNALPVWIMSLPPGSYATSAAVWSTVIGASSSYNPLAAISWDHAFWAEDPDWTNPGNGNAVSSWRNGGSQGVAAEQATSGNRPTFYDSTPPASGLNSQPVVYFPDTGGPFWLDTAGASALTQPVTIVAIQNTTDPDLSQTGETSLIDAPDTSGTDRMILRPSSNGATLLMNAGSTRRFGVSIANFPALIVAVFNGASSTYEHNGASYSPGGTVGANTLGNLRIGADPNGNAWIDGGSVAFIGIIEGTLTAGDIADLKAWATDHYGITIS